MTGFRYPKFNINEVCKWYEKKVKIIAFRWNTETTEFEYSVIEVPVAGVNPVWVSERVLRDEF